MSPRRRALTGPGFTIGEFRFDKRRRMDEDSFWRILPLYEFSASGRWRERMLAQRRSRRWHAKIAGLTTATGKVA